MSLNMKFLRTEVVNKDKVSRCLNKAIEIDEKNLDYTLSKALMIRAYLIKILTIKDQKNNDIIIIKKKEKICIFYCLLYDLSIFCA